MCVFVVLLLHYHATMQQYWGLGTSEVVFNKLDINSFYRNHFLRVK